MLLIDDLLLSPISGFQFILRTLARAAEEEYTDDAPIKDRLLELQTELEEGSISEEEYVEQEREVLTRLREIQNRRMQMAGVTPEEAERLGRPMIEIAVELPKKSAPVDLPEDSRPRVQPRLSCVCHPERRWRFAAGVEGPV